MTDLPGTADVQRLSTDLKEPFLKFGLICFENDEGLLFFVHIDEKIPLL